MHRSSSISLIILSSISLWGIPSPVQAQSVQADGSAIGTIVTPSAQTFTITGGRQLQQNLFHSFSSFSIPTGSKAVFDLIGNPGVSSIFSRVTGSNVSNIDGLIQTINSSNPVNLFLMNPNGIIFGPNARLNIGGSFTGTTARGIQFQDGTVFNAETTGDAALLTVSTPIGLQFGTNPSPIVVQNIGHKLASVDPLGITPVVGPVVPGLDVKLGQSIALIGGDLQFQGGIVNATNITLGSVAGPGTVEIQNSGAGLNFGFNPSQQLGNISMIGRSLASVSGLTAGTINLVSKTLTMKDGSILLSRQFGPFKGGSINLNVQDRIDLIGASSDGKIRTGVVTESLGSGNGPTISVKTPQLNLDQGATIGGRTVGAGAAGDITIQSDRIVLDGYDPSNPLLSSVIASSSLGSGASSYIQIKAKQVVVRSGGAITSRSFGPGRSGDIDLDIEDVQLSGTSPIGFQSNLGAVSYRGGSAGNLRLRSRTISIEDGASITTSASGSGSAGDIDITATDSINLKGPLKGGTSEVGSGGDVAITTPDAISLKASLDGGTTGISSSAAKNSLFLVTLLGLDATPSGNAGTLTIQTPRLTLSDGASLSVSNQGNGTAGTIVVNAGTIALTNNSNITSSTINASGGNIKLTSQQLLLRDRSRIESASLIAGDGGNILLNSDLVVGLGNSDIIANASKGSGGNITINTKLLLGLQYRDRLTDGNDITASSDFGVSGNVMINNLSLIPQTQNSRLEDNPFARKEISDSCGSQSQGQFIITGRGGIPKSPSQFSDSQRVWSDLRRVWNDLRDPRLKAKSVDVPIAVQHQDTIVEASQIQRSEDGSLVLIGPELGHLVAPVTCAMNEAPISN